jgi:hypothetical protein
MDFYRTIATRNSNVSPLLLAVLISSKQIEVVTAVNTKNSLFWDMKTQFVPHRKHIASPLQSPAG